MYAVDAELLIRLGESFVQMEQLFYGGRSDMFPIEGPQIIWLHSNLPIMAAHCEHLQLDTTRAVIMAFYRDYESHNPTWVEVRTRLSAMKESFKAELNNRLCLFVHVHKSELYSLPLEATDDAILSSFPSVREDLVNAGRCYAFEQNTASVFHSMRVFEKGLHVLANDLQLAPKLPIVLQQWQNIIEQIEAKIKELGNTLPKGLYKSEQLKIYSDAALEFWFLKEAWRNHVMHSRETYSEYDALRVLIHVRSFMHSLSASGLKEVKLAIPAAVP